MSPSALPKSAPDLHIPKSSSTVTVKVIDRPHTRSQHSGPHRPHIHYPRARLPRPLAPPRPLPRLLNRTPIRPQAPLRPRHAQRLAQPRPCLHGHDPRSGPDVTIQIKKDVAEILQDNNVDVQGGAIEAIIWSHWHPDHTGNPALFPPAPPSSSHNFTPGYPTNPAAPLLDADFDGRDVKEVAFSDLHIAGFRAHDFFHDGSFYILDAPGHTIAHICALARVTSNPDTFIFLGADACHHGAEFRPTAYLPLPSQINLGALAVPNHADADACICPGSMFAKLSPSPTPNTPFYRANQAFAHDSVEAHETIEKLELFDATPNVWVVIAHDASLLEPDLGVEFFPSGNINSWKEKGLGEKTRWRFLKDLKRAAEAAQQSM
ncbi:Cytochrome P450 monooxygenase [Lachnellula occidentalis]|uniref:Cytochrome P450 monooxygenase n=1 Tax=Lachnellula occidentalis TaxID=215460 RepID=A0A8H8RKK0_9HELO|nr:Cytochrome P450 monooxygenase [Lachnellula occidentalis]